MAARDTDMILHAFNTGATDGDFAIIGLTNPSIKRGKGERAGYPG